ncbi:hypothetical protein EON81_22160 [bacterium]|nr:MAG: hypothetical protein EON81_22160 [bacterium]
MFWDILDFVDFLGCLGECFGGSGSFPEEGRRKDQKLRLDAGMSKDHVTEYVDKGKGIVAFDQRKGRFGVVLGTAPAVFFATSDVISADISVAEPAILRLSVHRHQGDWSRTVRFRSGAKAERWRAYLTGGVQV